MYVTLSALTTLVIINILLTIRVLYIQRKRTKTNRELEIENAGLKKIIADIEKDGNTK